MFGSQISKSTIGKIMNFTSSSEDIVKSFPVGLWKHANCQLRVYYYFEAIKKEYMQNKPNYKIRYTLMKRK
jgi:hypothetical protein